MEKQTKIFKKIWDKYKFVGLMIVVGVILLLWPTGSRSAQTQKAAQPEKAEETSLEETEKKMQEILSKIKGVGQLEVMLTMESGSEQHYMQDTELSYSGQTSAPDDYTRKSQTVIVSGDSGGDEAVETKTTEPVYRGALVVCQGAENAEVKLSVTQAVAALTGLSSDRITVVKCQ